MQSFLASYLHTFTPTLLNNLSFSYDRHSYVQRRFGSGERLAQGLGLTNVSAAAFPTFNINGYALLGAQGTTNAAVARIQTPITDVQFLDSISKYAGKHAIKSGSNTAAGQTAKPMTSHRRESRGSRARSQITRACRIQETRSPAS